MGRLGTCATGALLLALALGLAGPVLMRGLFRLSGNALDPTVGIVERAEPSALVDRFRGKSALVVGGTRGIGRGVALELARAGSSVGIVGRSEAGGAAAVASMSGVAPSKKQRFRAYSHDLFTVKGCSRFVGELERERASFDFVVLTVGMWPDLNEPNTTDGINKVVALDLLARFVIFEGVRPLLREGARVMNVLASTSWMPLPSTEDLKAIVAGANPSPGFGVLPAAAVSADAFLQRAAARYPAIRFVGTQPGLVSSDLPRSTFPGWVADLMALLMAPIAQSEEECGEAHVQILSSPNVGRRQVSYFNYLLEARDSLRLAYDEEFGEWLWAWLESTAAKHK